MNEQGEQGDQGDQGIAGPRGVAGDRGVQGSPGPSGGQGIEGPPGTAGEGIQGVAGPRGARGRLAPLRWGPAIGYLLLVIGLAYTLVSIQRVNVDSRARIAAQARTNCEQANATRLRDFQQQQASRKFLEAIADLDDRVAKTATDLPAARIVAERADFWRGLAANIPPKSPALANCDFKP